MTTLTPLEALRWCAEKPEENVCVCECRDVDTLFHVRVTKSGITQVKRASDPWVTGGWYGLTDFRKLVSEPTFEEKVEEWSVASQIFLASEWLQFAELILAEAERRIKR